jgi:hypothetical protein
VNLIDYDLLLYYAHVGRLKEKLFPEDRDRKFPRNVGVREKWHVINCSGVLQSSSFCSCTRIAALFSAVNALREIVLQQLSYSSESLLRLCNTIHWDDTLLLRKRHYTARSGEWMECSRTTIEFFAKTFLKENAVRGEVLASHSGPAILVVKKLGEKTSGWESS